MNNIKKAIVTVFCTLLLIGLGYAFRCYQIQQLGYESVNICEDYDLITRLIDKNINPFNKFKFIKQRNVDCKVLLITNKDDALAHHNPKYCSVLDASTSSVSMLILTYVHEMYDREAASKELKQMVPLMVPYEYCPQYTPNIYDLIKLKKRLGL
jgi:hypothetical protein